MRAREAVDLEGALSRFRERRSPRIVAGFNGHDVMVVEVEGTFVWHSHPETDDRFLVLKGRRLPIEMRDGGVVLGPGQLDVVPRGVEHRPVADEETHLLLIEPVGTPNTGDPATAVAKLPA